ncbi:MAG: DUF554 domain-containing protein [Spirochaetales bacterium]|jgi:uncharacterized membrane protein YqgA involved in biofilm formation|nr:DUF554 domain-containing protein [Spirochaetales bacterium]
MIAVFVNCATVLVGSVIGYFFHKKIHDEFKNTVYIAVGVFTLVIGMSMALESKRIVYLAFSLVAGGLAGSALSIEGKIYAFGEFLKKRCIRGSAAEDAHNFALGFLNASVLFCVGAMSLVGSFKAGTEGDYTLIFTKSVMDGFMAVLMTAALGPGVAFSVIPILVYQGGLTLLATVVKPWVSPLMLSELTGTGGALILMIGFNLLQLKNIKTGNFIMALVVIAVLVLLDPMVLLGMG